MNVLPPEVRCAAGTGGSVLVETCQICGSPDLQPVIFVGYLPPVNTMLPIGARPIEQPAYPAQVLRCSNCTLVQLGLVVDPAILFPPDYAYTSGTTRNLREDFAQLCDEVITISPLSTNDLVVDIGSNDGTLLGNFRARGIRVRGIEPTNAAKLAIDRGIPTNISFFDAKAARQVIDEDGMAKVITATNVFAHMENIHAVLTAVRQMMHVDGIFVTESHYWSDLVRTLQYDTIYHEHLRHYTVGSISYLLRQHGLEVFSAHRIPTHGGSIRVYASQPGRYPRSPSVDQLIRDERDELTSDALSRFRERVALSKVRLHALLAGIRERGERVYAIGAPSRASTLVNHVGLDDALVDCVLEILGSRKIGRYMPGTLIPVLEEHKLFDDQPEHALLLSWHIADELISKLSASGYRGDYIIPLPEPTIIRRPS